MTEIFGLSMNTILIVMVALFAVCAASVAVIFISNRTMFRMGVRNARRRRAQSALVVTGLMLATIIITAAFGTGDAIDYSATKATYENLQRTDLSLHHFRPETGEASLNEQYAPESVTAALEQRFAGDDDIAGFMPFLYEGVPILNTRTNLAEPLAYLAGFDAERLARFGGLRLVGGGQADVSQLGDNEMLLGERMAEKVDARVGDTILVFARGESFPLTVAGIVKDERASGAIEFGPNGQITGMAVKLATVQRITGREGQISTINVALEGTVRSALARSDAGEAKLAALQDDPAAKAAVGLDGYAFQVETVKADAVEGSKLTASVFTTVFLVLGLFSIAAGAMLIFTLFVMLAAERRPEMGIARAVGAQRTHLLQAFVAEGTVYDLVAGVVGVGLGVAAAWGLVVGAKALIGESLSIMEPHIAPRSLAISFCLGAVLTFMTVVLSSIRISQLNIVAAVRGQANAQERREAKRATRWRWIALGVPALIIAPLGIYLIMRRGLGMPWAWIVGPGGLVLGVLTAGLGATTHILFLWMLGGSLIILAATALASYYGANRRLAWSLGGLVLSVFWLMPDDLAERAFGEFKGSSMEMFVLSGIMIVTGFTLLIVFNASLLVTFF
jgi:putative ABC transport system permease protein